MIWGRVRNGKRRIHDQGHISARRCFGRCVQLFVSGDCRGLQALLAAWPRATNCPLGTSSHGERTKCRPSHTTVRATVPLYCSIFTSLKLIHTSRPPDHQQLLVQNSQPLRRKGLVPGIHLYCTSDEFANPLNGIADSCKESITQHIKSRQRNSQRVWGGG